MSKRHAFWILLSFLVGSSAFAGCAQNAGSIIKDVAPIIIEATKPAPVPEVKPEAPRATLAFVITDAETGAPIEGAQVAIAALGLGWASNADGYAPLEMVQGSYAVAVQAIGYEPLTVEVVLSGNLHLRAPLFPIRKEPPTPAPTPDPTPEPKPQPKPEPAPEHDHKTGVVDACGFRDNTMAISHACLAAVALASPQWKACEQGNGHACHYFVREVASALNATQHTDRWGLIKKTGGGQHVDGYGEDVVAYLPQPLPLGEPTWRWRGADVIGGAGAPGARFQGGPLNEAIPCSQWKDGMPWCNRESDIWAPVPR